jgi:hypothetical protein
MVKSYDFRQRRLELLSRLGVFVVQRRRTDLPARRDRRGEPADTLGEGGTLGRAACCGCGDDDPAGGFLGGHGRVAAPASLIAMASILV